MQLILGKEYEGMIYVGTLLNEKNDFYALLVEKEDRGVMDWDDAMKTDSLPTIEELNLMRAHHKLLNMTDWYWSSTEYVNVHSWIQRFSDGNQNIHYKFNLSSVRCVRRLILDFLKDIESAGESDGKSRIFNYNNSGDCNKYGVCYGEDFRFMNYPLIKKWLDINIEGENVNENTVNWFVFANELEAKLAEGFEVTSAAGSIFSNNLFGPNLDDNFVALAIGKQSIKKQTQAEAALEFVKIFANQSLNIITPGEAFDKAKKILEMKDDSK